MQKQLALKTSQLRQARVHAQYQGMLLDSEQMLKLLAVDANKYSSDVDFNLRQGRTLEPSLQDRGHLLMQSPKFQSWLSVASSRCLFVDDYYGSGKQRISALTFVCALTTQGLQDENINNIKHFCGLHTSHDDPLRGPRGLLRALLAQLARLQSFGVSFVDQEKYEQLRNFSVRRLCDLLVNLIRQLPAGSIMFCILDGIAVLYNNDCWLEETTVILRTLRDLASNNVVRATFKVIVTSPMANKYLDMEIHPQDYLALRQGTSNNGGNALTTRRLLMQSQRIPYEDGGCSSSGFSDRAPFAVDEDVDEGFMDGDDDENVDGGDFYEGDLRDDDN